MKIERKKTYLEKLDEDLTSKIIKSYKEFIDLPDEEELTEDMIDDYSVSTVAMRHSVPIARVRKMLIGKQ